MNVKLSLLESGSVFALQNPLFGEHIFILPCSNIEVNCQRAGYFLKPLSCLANRYSCQASELPVTWRYRLPEAKPGLKPLHQSSWKICAYDKNNVQPKQTFAAWKPSLYASLSSEGWPSNLAFDLVVICRLWSKKGLKQLTNEVEQLLACARRVNVIQRFISAKQRSSLNKCW